MMMMMMITKEDKERMEMKRRTINRATRSKKKLTSSRPNHQFSRHKFTVHASFPPQQSTFYAHSRCESETSNVPRAAQQYNGISSAVVMLPKAAEWASECSRRIYFPNY